MALFTYDDGSRRESLLDIIRDISPIASNYLVDHLSTSEATNTLHEWVVRNISRPTSDNNTAEGTGLVDAAGDAPVRSNNVTAIYKRDVIVSGTEEQARRALPGSAMKDEKAIKLLRLKADMEFGILRGAKASGASGTARGMAGIVNCISTNITARSSGTSLSVTELEDILEESWNGAANGFQADTILVPMGLKRKIASFTTSVTRYTDDAGRIYNDVSVYEGSSAMVKVIPHRDVLNSAGTTHLIAIREELFRIAFFRQPDFKMAGLDGDRERGFYVTELTVESLFQAASVRRTGYAQQG